MSRATWQTIGAPAGHRVVRLDDRVRCQCGWSTRVGSLSHAQRAHVAHCKLVALGVAVGGAA